MSDRSVWAAVFKYYAIACGVSWTLWAPIVLGREGLRLLDIAPSIPVFISMGTVGPAVACYLAHRFSTGNWRAVQVIPHGRRQWVWTAIAPLLILFCWFVAVPALISEGPPFAWRWRPVALAGILVPMFNYNLLGGPLFEEFGWRGFLQTRLQEIMASWKAALAVGTFWAVWHAPLFLVEGWSNSSPVAYLLILAGLSLVMMVGFNASGGAVLPAILMHSAFNSSPRFIGAYLEGTSTRAFPATEWYIAGGFLVTGTLLAVASWRASRRDRETHADTAC